MPVTHCRWLQPTDRGPIERAVTKEEQRRLRSTRREERQRKLSAKESLAQGIIDGSYARYLLND